MRYKGFIFRGWNSPPNLSSDFKYVCEQHCNQSCLYFQSDKTFHTIPLFSEWLRKQTDTLTGHAECAIKPSIKHTALSKPCNSKQLITTTTFQMQNANHSDNNKGVSAPASPHCH